MKKVLVVLALVVLVGSGLAALAAPAPAHAQTVKVFTLADNGQTVTVNLGDYFLLDLGSGYTWTISIANPYGRAPVLQMLYWQNGGKSTGLFQAIGRGQATVNGVGISNCKPCDRAPLKFTLTVNVP